MALGNKGFASLVTEGGNLSAGPRLPPKTGILGARENRLAELATGHATTRIHEAVDPTTCRIWSGHNRDYAALNLDVCTDLITSLRAQGRQEVPAIVRRVSNDPLYRFEVICGARRHWSVCWLRNHDYPDFKFLVEPREMTDEEAFRIADLENRSRKDLSDYERATDYARAVERYYDGNQQRMADRLQVGKSWLSRYLELAKLPPEVLACFISPHVIGISHAAALAPLLNHPRSRATLLAAAATLTKEQTGLRTDGGTPLSPATVILRLAPVKLGRVKPSAAEEKFRNKEGKVCLTVRRGGREGVLFKIPNACTGDRRFIVEAIDTYLRKFADDR